MTEASILPSQQSARDFVHGVPGAWLQLLLHAAARGALVGAGVAAAGVPSKYWLRVALAGTLAIETFVLVHEFTNKDRAQ
jgi:hypothetical protein